MKELHKPATLTASELISSLKTEFYNAVGEPSLRAMRKTNYEKLERAIATDVLDGKVRLREPRNYAQLLQVSLSTEQLVQQLLRRAEILDNGATHSPAFDEARQLVTKGYPNFSFPSIDPERAAKNSSLLNSQIRALTSAENLSFKERIGRVCYNLLVSAYPPDMHTYNTLIVAFDKSGHHALSDVIVFSFFHQRLMNPTPSTYAAIFNHYKSTNNHGQFLRAISCLAGLDKLTGAKIRRRHINDVAQMPDLQKWAADLRRRTRTGQWVWEHGPLSTTVVETMLDGLLHFKLFADAATLFITCVRYGVALSARTMTHLFDECVAALDWKAAVRMVRGLMFSLQEWENLLSSQTDGASAAHLLSRASALIDICGLGSNGQEPSKKRLANLYISAPKRNRFLESMAEANQLFAGMELEYYHTPRKEPCDELLGFKRRLLQIESLWKEYEHVQKTTSSIESKLLYPQFSTSFRTSMALHVGANAVRRSLELCQEIENALPSTKLPMGRPLVSSHATKNVEDESLTREMDSLTVDAKQFGIHLEPRPRQVSSTPTSMTGCASEQGHALLKELDHKPRGLLAWSRQPNRTGSVETRHWAIGP